ncbi:cytoplasmic protein, partial [Salmonella enterica]|nr:cytoplasmic protein [Salmonella enterica]
MRVSEQVLLCVLRQGGCIRSFWRRSARLAGTSSPIVPDGLVLETPGEPGDTPLCHMD